MSEFINMADMLGEEEVKKRIIEGTLIELNDNNIKQIRYDAFYNNSSLINVNLPNVKKINSDAFYNCSKLKNIYLPNATYLGSSNNGMFYNCKCLTNVNLQNITSVGQYTFRNCYALTYVDCSNATSVGTNAFQNCSSLPYVDLPKATNIAAAAFNGCTSLKNIILRNEKVCSLSNSNALGLTFFGPTGVGGTLLIPRALIESYKTATNWSIIWSYGYNNFLAIEDYTVDGTITGEIDWDKFYASRGLVNKKNSNVDNADVTSVRNYAFYNNTTLTSVNFSNITSIGEYAFYNCLSLESVKLPATPPTVSNNSFDNINSACVFYVPTGSLVEYQGDSNWSIYTTAYSFVEEDR